MNKSEIIVHDWLSKKYPDATISYQIRASPDFILSNEETYEVKRGYLSKDGKIHIVITRYAQLTEIIEKYPKAILIVVVENKIVKQMLVKDLIGKKFIDGIVIHRYEPEDWIRIRCSEELRMDFKKAAVNFGGYKETIEAFLEVYKKKPALFKSKRRKMITYV